jgi:hypothetical protein
MPVVINGSTGISGTDGSAGTPAIQGTDTNTGMFFPSNDQIAFAEGGVEVMRIDASGNVGIGTSSPADRLSVSSASQPKISVTDTNGGAKMIMQAQAGTLGVIGSENNVAVSFITNNTERARISATGVVNLGSTMYSGAGSTLLDTLGSVVCSANQQANRTYESHNFNTYPNLYSTVFINVGASSNIPTNLSGNGYRFIMGAGDTGGRGFDLVGTSSGQLYYRARENGTWYQVTSSIPSDYRIKENITPIESPLETLDKIKPVTFDFKDIPNPGSNTSSTTYQWSNDGTPQLGFIAHELQEVIPSAVNGEKDAVTDVGGIQPQTLNVMPIVALLTAAIKELKADNDMLKDRIAALESR